MTEQEKIIYRLLQAVIRDADDHLACSSLLDENHEPRPGTVDPDSIETISLLVDLIRDALKIYPALEHQVLMSPCLRGVVPHERPPHAYR
jgi:hypothetical protein